MSVYNPSIPNATDLISNSQAPFKVNFTQLNTQFGVDHIPFNNSGVNGTGHHQQVTIDTPLFADPMGFASTVVYTKNDTASKPQLWFINTTKTAQLTSSLYTYTPTLTRTNITFNYSAQNGFYYIAGGLTYFFGQIITSSETALGLVGNTLTLSLPTTPISGGGGNIESAISAGSTFTTDTWSGFATNSPIITFTTSRPTGKAVQTLYTFNGFYQ